MNQLILCAVILACVCLTSIQAANYCYSCTSCTDPFDKSGNASCPSGSDTCMKTYIGFPDSITAITSGTSKKLIFRSCVPAAACSKSFSLMILGYGIDIGCCSDNLCNGAELTKKISMTTLFFPLLATFYYLRK